MLFIIKQKNTHIHISVYGLYLWKTTIKLYLSKTACGNALTKSSFTFEVEPDSYSAGCMHTIVLQKDLRFINDSFFHWIGEFKEHVWHIPNCIYFKSNWKDLAYSEKVNTFVLNSSQTERLIWLTLNVTRLSKLLYLVFIFKVLRIR